MKQNNLFFLEFEDGLLNYSVSEAKERVKDILAKSHPDRIFVPSEHDIQKDHRSTNIIVSLALDELALHLSVYTYVVWSDGRKLQKILKKLSEILRPPTAIEMNISDFLELKCRAISTYKSQVSMLFPSQKKPILDGSFLTNFMGPTERFVKKLR